MSALFVKSIYKILKVILVSYMGLQAKILLSLKILFWNFEKILSGTTSNNDLFAIILGDCNPRFSVW